MLTLAFLTAFELHLLLFSYSPLVSKIMPEMGLSYTQASLIFSMCILTLVLLRIPWGLLSDRIGSSATLRLATTIMGIFGLLRGFAINYETLLVYQLLLGVGFAAILPCLPKLVDAWFEKKVGPATGVYVAGFPIGEIAGFGLTPHILAFTGNWRNVFHIYGIFGLVLTALWWTISKEPSRRRSEVLAHRSILNTSLKKEVAKVLRVKEVWILTGLCISAMGCYDTLATWLPSMLEFRNVPPEIAGLMASMLPLGFLLAGPTIGASSDRVGLRRPFIWILGLASGAAILAIPISSDIPLWVTIFLAGFCTAGIVTLILVIPTELPEIARLVATSVGLISSLGNIGAFTFPIAVGYLKDTTGSFLPAMVMLALIAEITLILGLLMKETGRKGSNSKCITE
jgi:cyanate permease